MNKVDTITKLITAYASVWFMIVQKGLDQTDEDFSGLLDSQKGIGTEAHKAIGGIGATLNTYDSLVEALEDIILIKNIPCGGDAGDHFAQAIQYAEDALARIAEIKGGG